MLHNTGKTSALLPYVYQSDVQSQVDQYKLSLNSLKLGVSRTISSLGTENLCQDTSSRLEKESLGLVCFCRKNNECVVVKYDNAFDKLNACASYPVSREIG